MPPRTEKFFGFPNAMCNIQQGVVAGEHCRVKAIVQLAGP